MNIYLLEMTYFDTTALMPVTLRFGSKGYCTLPTDSPANTFYEPRLKVPANYQCQIFQDGLKGDSSQGNQGVAQLLNLDGYFDQFLPQAFDGHPLRILYGDDGGSYSAFTPLFTGTMMAPEFTWQYMNVKVRDYTEFFQKALSQFVYLGNNVAGVGIEGTPNDIMGQTKPLSFGRCWNVTPAWVSASGLIYQVHNGPIKAVDLVFANGAPMPLDCSVNGVVEAATASYVSPLSFFLASVNKTAAYVAGMVLTVWQASGNANFVVVSSAYTGGNTVITIAPPNLPAYMPTLYNAAITKIAYGGGDCPTLAALQAATPTAGMFITCLARGVFATSGGASSAITAHVRGDATNGAYVNTVADIVQRIAASYTQRPRTNLIQYSETFSNAAWLAANASIAAASSVTPPISGLSVYAFNYAGTGPFTLTQTASQGTGMYCFSVFVQPGSGQTLFRLKIANHANTANNCLADFDVSNGTVLLKQANGNAVGPQYQATGFITDGGVIAYPKGGYRLWVAGQPDSAFTSLDCILDLLSGTDASYTDSFTSSGTVYLTGAQLEAYSSPAIYTGPTFTAPVTGYDPVTGPTINTASFAALDALAPYEAGYYVAPGDSSTAADVMDALLESVGGWWAFDRSGNLCVGQFNKPSPLAAPVASFMVNQPLRGDNVERSAAFQSTDGAPAYRVVVAAVKNWTVQAQSTLTSSLWQGNPTFVSWVGQEWRNMRAENISTLYTHPLACELDFTSFLAWQADGLSEANRLLTLYSGRLDRFKFTVKLDQALAIDIGGIVNLSVPRWNLNNGQNFVVVGITEAHETGRVTLEVLG